MPDETMRTAFAGAFREWHRRYREEPERFMREIQVLRLDTAEIGEQSAGYFIALLDELAGGRPWNEIAA